MMNCRVIVLMLFASLVSSHVAANDAVPMSIEIVARAGESNDVGDVVVVWKDGRHERLTKGAHAEQAKLGAAHGPTSIELFSLSTGKQIQIKDAYADDLPPWAKPYAD